MATIAELLNQSDLPHSDSPLLDAQLLLGHVLGCDRTYLYTWPEKQVSDAQFKDFLSLLARRQRGEPVAYLLGHQEFWSLPLKVSPATLIPRADTETLIAHVLKLALPDPARVLDLGTGTGAIALALASERPRWQVTAVDNQPDSVCLAKENAAELGLDSVDIHLSQWFDSISGVFDLVVSNPPYIDGDDPHLDQGDVRFEPRSALVAGDGGLADIQHIVATSRRYLSVGGFLYMEHGMGQGAEVRALLSDAGFSHCETVLDLAGRDRISGGQWPGNS